MAREPKKGELRGIHILEMLERLFKRPESRMDAAAALKKLSPNAQKYAENLVKSGPLANVTAAKACGLSGVEFEAAAEELESAVKNLKYSK